MGLTKGDTARLTVEIKDDNNYSYSCVTGDTLVLSVKQLMSDTTYVFQKSVTDFINGNIIAIVPTDTSSLSAGTYYFDVQLTLADGDVYTVIGTSKFELLEGVTG